MSMIFSKRGLIGSKAPLSSPDIFVIQKPFALNETILHGCAKHLYLCYVKRKEATSKTLGSRDKENKIRRIGDEGESEG